MKKYIVFISLLALVCSQVSAPSLAQTAISPEHSVAVQSGSAKVDGALFHYDVYGTLGPDKVPLLILHGAYMSAEGMRPMAEGFARTRPVIVLDQRGHGRTGDVAGPITYERLADDASDVLVAAHVSKVDVLGYSVGGGAAIQLAIRHPEQVSKLVSISANYQSETKEVKIPASVFDGTPIKRNYERLSPTPKAFPQLVEKMNALLSLPQAWPASQIKGISARTMIIIGDYDIIRPEQALDMYRLRGGGDPKLSASGFLMAAPPARLAILPGTSHLGMMAQPGLIVELVIPFLDDAKPAMPQGFF